MRDSIYDYIVGYIRAAVISKCFPCCTVPTMGAL